MSILSGGNVGIGTSTPSMGLQVNAPLFQTTFGGANLNTNVEFLDTASFATGVGGTYGVYG